MKFLKMPNLKYLRTKYTYDAKTGIFYIKHAKGMKPVGCMNQEGAQICKIKTKIYKLNRIIYYWYHGIDPAGKLVDHKNGDKLDNRIENLRLATFSQNVFNCKLHRTNKSGKKGVCFCKTDGKWRAYINVEKVRIHLGRYDNKKDAIKARSIAEKKYYGEFVREGT